MALSGEASAFPFFPLADGFGQKELNLRVDGAEIVLCPCSNIVPQRRRKAEKHLLLRFFAFLGSFFPTDGLGFQFFNARKAGGKLRLARIQFFRRERRLADHGESPPHQ